MGHFILAIILIVAIICTVLGESYRTKAKRTEDYDEYWYYQDKAKWLRMFAMGLSLVGGSLLHQLYF